MGQFVRVIDNITGLETEKDIDTLVDVTALTYDGTGKTSARFNEIVTASTLKTAIDEIFKFTATNPSVSLSLSPSSTREKGNTLASITLNSSFSQGTNPSSAFALLELKRAGGTIESVVNPTSPNSFVETTPVTDTTSFSATITDALARTNTANATISFLYPILHLVGAVGLGPAQIYAGATKILSSSRGRTLTFAPVNQVVYYAIPSSLGALTSIKDINLFETFPDWTLRSESIVGLDGSSQAYRVYEFKNLTSASATYTFA